MTKITVDLIDNLMCDETLHNIVKGRPTGFQMLFYVTFAQYQKTLEAQADTPEPESETDFEPGLCPVAEQVATLTEKLDCAMHRIAELDDLAEVQQDILNRLVNIVEMHTNILDATIERAVSPKISTSKDVHQLLSAIASGLTQATK